MEKRGPIAPARGALDREKEVGVGVGWAGRPRGQESEQERGERKNGERLQTSDSCFVLWP